MAKTLKEIDNDNGNLTFKGRRIAGIALDASLVERIYEHYEPDAKVIERDLHADIGKRAPKDANAYVIADREEGIRQRQYYVDDVVAEEDADDYEVKACVVYYLI